MMELRRRWFAENPLCVHCLARGFIRPATQLDHIVALDNGGEDVDDNRQGLCADCHRVKTNKDLGYKDARLATGLDGWPVDEPKGRAGR